MDKSRRNIYLFRFLHGVAAVFFISCLAFVYYSAVTRTHSLLLYGAMVVLAVEGLTVALNRGLCPLTGLQHKLGDDKGFFNLFLPDAVARMMVPFWFATAILGYVLVWLRW